MFTTVTRLRGLYV